jgi:hypothetical protein
VTDETLQDFRTQLTTQKITIDEEAFKTDLNFIKALVHYEIDLALFGVEEAAWRWPVRIEIGHLAATFWGGV